MENWVGWLATGEEKLLILGLATLAKTLDMKLSSSLKCYSRYVLDYSTVHLTWAELEWRKTKFSSHVLLLSVGHDSES